MERRVRRNSHARCEAGEKLEIASNTYLSLYEVVQCYLKDLESKYAVLHHSLVGFKRINLRKGESKTVNFKLRRREFEVVNDEGNRILDSKRFKLFVGISQPDERSIELTETIPLEKIIELQ